MTTPALPDPKTIRARLMLTLDEMARRMHVNRSTVWRWEHGATPQAWHMRKLARIAARLAEKDTK